MDFVAQFHTVRVESTTLQYRRCVCKCASGQLTAKLTCHAYTLGLPPHWAFAGPSVMILRRSSQQVLIVHIGKVVGII